MSCIVTASRPGEMATISSHDMGYSGSRAKHFEPDFVRMVLGKNWPVQTKGGSHCLLSTACIVACRRRRVCVPSGTV